VRATKFEFSQRFWIFGVIFWLGFASYSFDHVNAGVALLGAHLPYTSTQITLTVAGVKFLFPMTYEMFGLDPNSTEGRGKLHIAFGIAALLLASAAMVRTWATAYLRTDIVEDSKLRAERLVADGPYRHVRNPLYFANILMALSFGFMASRVGWAFIVLAMIAFTYRLIGREEQELAAAQGANYRQYMRTVPRLWPSIRPRVPSSGLQPRWPQAWLAEAFFFWGFAAALACFAITLNFAWAWAIFMLCILVYILMWKVRARLSRKS